MKGNVIKLRAFVTRRSSGEEKHNPGLVQTLTD